MSSGISTTSVDVILTKSLEKTLQVLQFPTWPANRSVGSSEVESIRAKFAQDKYEFNTLLDSRSANYSKGRAERLAANADNDREHLMRSLKLRSCQSVDQNQYCVGVFKNGKLYLTPVSKVIQMTPAFQHIDAADKARRRRAQQKDDNDSSSQDESPEKTTEKKTRAITVKFGKNESAEAKAKRKRTYYYLKQVWDEEPWTVVTFINKQSCKSLVKNLARLSCSGTEKNELINTSSKTDYLKYLLPQADVVEKSEKPYAPSNELSVSGLKGMSLHNQILAILKSATVVRFCQLMTLVGSKADKESVISSLKKLAVVVRGCWVLSSKILYPDGSLSSGSGVAAELMRRGRDYILYRMNRTGYVMRKEMCSHTKLPGEEVRSILEAISELNSDTGWEFFYHVDEQFLDSNRAIRDEYSQFWYNRGKELCCELSVNFKGGDHSPRRTAGRSRNGSSESHGGGSPRRRRRSSSRTALQEEALNLLSEKTPQKTTVEEMKYRKRSASGGAANDPRTAGNGLGEHRKPVLSPAECETLRSRMENKLLVSVSDFHRILSHVTGGRGSLCASDLAAALAQLDMFEFTLKAGGGGRGEQQQALALYAMVPTLYSEEERTLLTRCTQVLAAKGSITSQSVPRLLHGLSQADKNCVDRVLNQLCFRRHTRWLPAILGHAPAPPPAEDGGGGVV